MKRKARDWKFVGLIALVSVASAATGAYLASRYVTPCVCMVGVAQGLVN